MKSYFSLMYLLLWCGFCSLILIICTHYLNDQAIPVQLRARWWMLQYYSHYSEIKCYFLQLKNWCFVTEKWLLYIMSMLMGPEGRGRSAEIESRSFEAFYRNSWNWAPCSLFLVISGSTWTAKEAAGLVEDVFHSGCYLSPTNLAEE